MEWEFIIQKQAKLQTALAISGRLIGAILLLLLSSSCQRNTELSPVCEPVVAQDGSVQFRSAKLIPEEWIALTKNVRDKRFGKVSLVVKENDKLYVFTGAESGMAMVLAPSGIDAFEIEGTFPWTGSPQSAYSQYIHHTREPINSDGMPK